MKIQTWVDVLENGQKEMYKKDIFIDQYKKLKEGRYIYTIEKVQNKRTLEQNNSLWGIPYIYFEFALNYAGIIENPTKLQVHHWCLHHFAPVNFVERMREIWENDPGMVDIKTGEVFKEPFRISSKDMTTFEFMEYYNNLQLGYLEFFSIAPDDYIPDPDKNYKNKNYENEER